MKKKIIKNTKKPRERANHMSVQNTSKNTRGLNCIFFFFFFFFLSGDDSCCLKCIIICSMYDYCN